MLLREYRVKDHDINDKASGKLISKKKVPRDMRGFAKLNKPSQAHLIAMTFDPEEPGTTLYYNKSCNQYRISTFFKYSVNIR